MNNLFRAPIRTFVAGLLAVLPVALTMAVIVWVASVVDQFIGPHSAVGRLLVSMGLTVVETTQGKPWYVFSAISNDPRLVVMLDSFQPIDGGRRRPRGRSGNSRVFP